MNCPTCKLVTGDLVEMAPSREPGQLACTTRYCRATVQLNDLGFTPAYFTPIPGPALTPANEKRCKLPSCGLSFVPNRGGKYCSESCRHEARQAGKRSYRMNPDVQDKSARTARIMAKVHAALGGAA